MKRHIMRNICWIAGLGFLLTGCTQRVAERAGNWIVQLGADNKPAFAANAVRPVFDCKTSPDPRYPCEGIGPEGFKRDLVARPITQHAWQLDDVGRGLTYRLQYKWYAMQGSCGGFGGFGHTILRDGRTFRARPEADGSLYEQGLTKSSAEHILEASNAQYLKRTGVVRTGGADMAVIATV